jgi:chromosome segregation ATPase
VDGDEGGMGLAEENAKLSAEIERQRGELEKSRKLSDEVDRLTRENARLAEEADRRLALSMQVREDLEGMSSHADQESRILKSRLDKAVAEIDGLRGEKASLEKLAEELAGERASLQAEKEDLQRAADEMKR